MADITPLKAIKAKCVDCMCGVQKEVKLCTAYDCALYPFRLGKNSKKNKRELTSEEKEVLRHRVAEARKNIQKNIVDF